MKRPLIFVYFFLLISPVFAQMEFGFDDKDAFSPHSIRQIRRADVMYNNSVWIRMDLREKQNEPFFAANSEITKIIIDFCFQDKEINENLYLLLTYLDLLLGDQV